jgi:hypothetical protein
MIHPLWKDYPLKQVDFDGNIHDSKTLAVHIENSQTKTIIKRFNMFGQEVGANEKGIIILVYSNGDVVKTFNEANNN